MVIKFISHDPSKKMELNTDSPTISLRISRNCRAVDSLIIDAGDNEIRSNYYNNFLQSRLNLLAKPGIKKETINDTVLFLLYPHNRNYSHFTLQCMSGFLLAREVGLVSDKLKIAVDQSQNFQKEICHIYGIKSDQIINLSPDTFYKFKHVIYCNSLFYSQLDDKTYQLYENISQKFQANLGLKLYITRSRDTIRATVNENEIVAHMKDNGFLVVDFARIPVQAQMALIQNSSVICAAHGASGANLVYKDKGKFKFIEYFSPTWPAECHARILKIKNCDYSPVMAHALSADRISPIRLDFNLLKRGLNKPVHTFSYKDPQFEIAKQEDTDIDRQLTILNKWSENNNLSMAMLRKGRYDKFLNYRDLNLLYSYDAYTLERYYESVFLTSNKIKFFKLTSQICETNILNAQTIVNFLLKAGEYKILNHIINKYNFDSNKLVERLMQTYATLAAVSPAGAIISWHDTILDINQDCNKLMHSTMPVNPLVITRNNECWGICIPNLDKYISKINDDYTVELSSEFTPMNISWHNLWNFSIICHNAYLNTPNDGSVSSSRHAKQWERFFVLRQPYPLKS